MFQLHWSKGLVPPHEDMTTQYSRSVGQILVARVDTEMVS